MTAGLTTMTKAKSWGAGRGPATRILASLAVLAVAGATFTVASLALFTDQETVPGNAFGTGTIDISTSPATAVVTMSNMAPGDQVTAPMTVSNDGTLELRYAISSTTTEDALAAELVLSVKSGVTTCDDANWTADGTVLYNGVLGTTGTIALVGSNAQGADAGDRVLAASANEVLCWNVTLPLATSNTFQGSNSTATFTFDAEQTANNP
jgi:predicted ribosomally synthesized peptide with SipW-like signal peptide